METVVKRNFETGRNEGHDLTGRRFNSFVLLYKTGAKDKNGYLIWAALCDCGKVVERPTYTFVRGFVKTCGCGPKGRPRIADKGSHVNVLYANYKKSAKDRCKNFILTKQECRNFFESPCFYCGVLPKVTHTNDNLAGEYAWNGIDRVDSAMGYCLENCVPCCRLCNWAKGTMSVEAFKSWIASVYSHLLLGGDASNVR